MEFYCVLSVGGSLASYHVQKEGEGRYKAVLKTSNGRRDDVPAEISLHNNGDGWQATPWHDEIVQSIIQAIEKGSPQISGNGG